MKKLTSYRALIRVLAIVNLIVLSVAGLLIPNDNITWVDAELMALFSTSGILLCINVSRQSRKVALACAALIFISSSVVELISGMDPSAVVSSVSVSVLVAVSIEGIRKFVNPRSWFGDDAIWSTAQEYARLLFTVLFLVSGILMLFSEGHCFWKFVVLLWLAVMCGALYYRAYTGRTVLIPAENEKKIVDMNRLSLRSRLSVEDENELVRLKMIYTRSENVMREKKPFLDSAFSLDNLAVLIYTNRGQLSRAINVYSEMNFKSYLNRHRIDYALELIEKDPRLKVSELSEMSGFCTPVSFTMAFKNNVNILPSDYLKDKMAEKNLSI